MSDVIASRDNPNDIETIETGHFRYRERKGAPWQPLRIMHESGTWVALLNGDVVPGSGAKLAGAVPFLLWRSPFHRITEQEYAALLRAYKDAPPGHPLRNPGERVDLRAAPPLYRTKADRE